MELLSKVFAVCHVSLSVGPQNLFQRWCGRLYNPAAGGEAETYKVPWLVSVASV